MTKFIISSDEKVIVNADYEDADYYGEYLELANKSKFVSNIFLFNTIEDANKVLKEYIEKNKDLEIKNIEI